MNYSKEEQLDKLVSLKACEYDGWQEVMCRWLYEFGYINKKDDTYYTKGEEDEDTTID